MLDRACLGNASTRVQSLLRVSLLLLVLLLGPLIVINDTAQKRRLFLPALSLFLAIPIVTYFEVAIRVPTVFTVVTMFAVTLVADVAASLLWLPSAMIKL